MKKLVLSALAVVSLAASAVEVGVTAVDQSSLSPKRYGYGVTVGETFAGVNVTAGASRFSREDNDQNRYTLVASKDVVSLGPVGFNGRLGTAYLSNNTGANGFALTAGVGATVPVMKNVTAGLSFDRQFGQSRVSSFDGNIITAGIKVGF
jgi:hypothetical protein